MGKFKEKEFLENLERIILDGKEQKIIFTPNPEICLGYLQDREFYDLLANADFLTPDGTGLYLGQMILDDKSGKLSNLLKFPYFYLKTLFCQKSLQEKYGEKIAGSDMTLFLVNFARQNKIKILISDLYNPDDSTKVEMQKVFEEKLKKAFPDLDFVYIIFKEENKEEIFEKIRSSGAKIAFSTLGMKRQEKNITEIIQNCPNINIGLGIGSSFDYFVGYQKRAPEFMRKSGFEWLYRIFTSPNKLWRAKRVSKALFVFPYVVWKEKYKK